MYVKKFIYSQLQSVKNLIIIYKIEKPSWSTLLIASKFPFNRKMSHARPENARNDSISSIWTKPNQRIVSCRSKERWLKRQHRINEDDGLCVIYRTLIDLSWRRFFRNFSDWTQTSPGSAPRRFLCMKIAFPRLIEEFTDGIAKGRSLF